MLVTHSGPLRVRSHQARSVLALAGALAFIAMTSPLAKADSDVATTREQRAAAAHAALVAIAQQVVVFSYGAQAWTQANVTQPWNQTNTVTPSAQTHPILLYVGNAATCGTASGLSYAQSVDLSKTTYVPSGFLVPLSGADCAVVYPNGSTMTVPNPGYVANQYPPLQPTITIGVNLLLAYYAPNPSGIPATGSMLSDMTPTYVTKQVAQLVSQFQKTSAGQPIISTGSGWVK